MPIRWRDEDPGLPIYFGQVSNGEYDPEPLTPTRLGAERLARRGIDDAIARTGMERRHFLRSACALAICLTAIDTAVARAAGLPGNLFYPFDPTSRHDTEAARAVIGPTPIRLRRPGPSPRIRPRRLQPGRLVLGQAVPPGEV